jgi:hypothetical protein
MTLPNFAVIGAMKAGTVSLGHYLDEHPNVFLGRGGRFNEPNYFMAEQNWPRGRDWYESLFDGAGGAAAIGECSPSYTWAHVYHGVPERMAEVVPQARLVYVVRDPIARMQSMYMHQVSAGRERRRAEVALLDDRYLGPSRYGFQLAAFLDHFDRSQVLVPGASGQTRVLYETLARLGQRITALAHRAAGLEKQITVLAEEMTPGLVAAEAGLGALTAAQLLLSYSHHGRIRSEAAFGMLPGTAPVPASSGRTGGRHRLNRLGDRQLNRALQVIAVARMRSHPPTQAYVQRRLAEGKTLREIRRCIKRYLARHLYRALQEPARSGTRNDLTNIGASDRFELPRLRAVFRVSSSAARSPSASAISCCRWSVECRSRRRLRRRAGPLGGLCLGGPPAARRATCQ